MHEKEQQFRLVVFMQDSTWNSWAEWPYMLQPDTCEWKQTFVLMSVSVQNRNNMVVYVKNTQKIAKNKIHETLH